MEVFLLSCKVLITKYIPEEGLEKLKRYCDIIMPKKNEKFTDDYIMEKAPEIDAIIVVRYKVTADFINKAKKLKMISMYAVGYDNVDLKAANANGIVVTNIPNAVTEATAELAFALMLTLSRRIIEADRFVRFENDKNWHPFLLISNELYLKKLGIIGFGRIGQAVAKRALAFGMEVYYYDTALDENSEVELDVKYLPFNRILEEMDYITLHVPYVPSTQHLIDSKELSSMKKESFIINASRGKVINQEALIYDLKKDIIKGAALDVYEKEPNVPDGLKKLNNVVLTPHIGTTTIETRTRMAKEAANRIIEFIEGKQISNIVNSDN